MIIPIIVATNQELVSVRNQDVIQTFYPASIQSDIAQSQNPPPLIDPDQKTAKFDVLPVGINIGTRSVLDSAFIMGYEDGSKAVNFADWLIPFADLTTALNLTVTTLEDGQLELKGVGLIKRIKPEELTTDPELGLVLSIAKIQELLGVLAQFDIAQYAIVFEPPWLNLQIRKNRLQELPVILDGLPVIHAPKQTLSVVGQDIDLSGNSNSSTVTSQGNFTVIGSLFGGSWLAKINQPDLLDSKTWQLSELQYFNQSTFRDYVIGSQPTFWQNQGSGNYWGFTAIQRFGFEGNDLLGSAFSPSQRLYSRDLERTIVGEADPGTLVQLVSENSDEVWGEVFVDSSRTYRFNNVPISSSYFSNNYRILLYPNGQLASTPIERKVTFESVLGQLNKGTSSLIISGGWNQQNTQDKLFGEFTDLRGGIGYRWGISDDLTVGANLVYDRNFLQSAELLYSPGNFPLRLTLSALQIDEKFKYNANLDLQPSRGTTLNFASDELSQRFNFNWSIFSGLGLSVNGNNQTNIINTDIRLSKNIGQLSSFATISISNKGQLDWNSFARWQDWQASYRANDTSTKLELNRTTHFLNSSGNETLNFSYETIKLENQINDLYKLSWRYQSSPRSGDRQSLWNIDLGYGIGSQGSGLLASVSTNIIPGLSLRLRYEEISASSADTQYRIELVPIGTLYPKFSPGNDQFENLRSQGGLFIQPFLDRNNNGSLDDNEEIYTQPEDLKLLLRLNNQTLSAQNSSSTSQGIFASLSPGMYRLDLDPAGYPLDWTPIQSAYATEVIAGSYTKMIIPFIASYTFAGTVKDVAGNPVGGARVEAISEAGTKIFSITNRSGIFYLEQLPIGSYTLQINGKQAQPGSLEITAETDTYSELNLIFNP